MKFIKRIVAALAFSGLVIGAASAADLPSRVRSPAVPVFAEAPFSWTGFYAGLNGGYAFKGETKYTIEGYNYDHDAKGFTGGVHGGFRQQFGALVVGVEGAAQFGNIHASKTIEAANTTTRINQLYTVTPTLGVAFDRVLVFGKAGWAGGNVTSTIATYDTADWKSGKFHNGWTVGGGVDYAFAHNWTVGLEYNYVRLANVKHTDTVYGDLLAINARPEVHQTRINLGYKF